MQVALGHEPGHLIQQLFNTLSRAAVADSVYCLLRVLIVVVVKPQARKMHSSPANLVDVALRQHARPKHFSKKLAQTLQAPFALATPCRGSLPTNAAIRSSSNR